MNAQELHSNVLIVFHTRQSSTKLRLSVGIPFAQEQSVTGAGATPLFDLSSDDGKQLVDINEQK